MLKNPEATAPIDKQPDEEPNRLAEPVDTEQPPRLPFAVVGVGGSAGGLEAFTELFKAMPNDSGMAFVLIQHLPPQRESMMADILSRHTKMPVQEVEDRMPVQRNHVYVIRPGHTMTIKDGLLHLGERVEKPGHSRPVDDFFRSLAEEQRERAIGVIMSGMGSNGSAGAQSIKAVGGVCIAQDPETAKFPSMPQHLIEVGLADFILQPKEIPEVLLRYASHPYANGTQSAEAIMRREKQHFSDILAILRTRTRQDFNGYKKPTVLRRIQRRMGLNQITRLSEYAKMLRQNPSEVSTLSDDLMIHVTGFFRDADAWESLRKQVIVPMIRRCENNAEVRCWVTACSSGEEAYTLAILLAEEAAAVSKPLDIKIFATDTADRTLSHARGGLYPGGIEAEITPQRLERFFEKDDSFYRVRKELREMVVFAPQNVLSDPPFSRLDIATCRNLLIYLEPPMQRRVLALLHFGLRESGTLFLGTSETVAGAEEMFEPIDKKWRIFRRVGPTRHGTVEFPLSPLSLLERDRADSKIITRAAIAQLTNKTLLDQYTPAAVVIDREHRIVFFHGNTEPYMINPRGEPTRDLLAMCRDNIRGAVRAALQQAVSQNQTATVLDGYIEGKQGRMRMAITVAALDPRLTSGFYLVSFEQRAEIAPPISEGDRRINDQQQVQDELGRIRDELQSTIEELQTSNEELKASNEEVTSVNEELQSTNEELETSKEELQSLNEELTTVNAQLQSKMEELEGTTNDLSSLLSSTDIAVIFLDTNFRIRRFTPATKDLIELIPSDMGRPLSDMATKFTDPLLMDDAKAVLEKLVPISREATSQSGHVYLRRVLPYRTSDNRINGVVITFVDITERKQTEEYLRAAKLAAESATKSKDEFLATLSHELRTPLSAILLWARVMRGNLDNAEQLREALDAIEKSAESQQSLVDDLLDTSRITAGKLRLELGEVDLADLLHASVEGILPSANARGVSIEAQIQQNGVVRADADRLRQVVWNLLSNAVKFTPGGGSVRVSLVQSSSKIEITVADSGQGISPEFLPHIFGAFSQQDSSSTRRHGGLGLGLAISKQLVELHGGTIRAESAGPGRGATFHIRLPTSMASRENASAQALHAAALPASFSLDGKYILLVEDENETRGALTHLLEKYGATVAAVSNAEAALVVYEKNRPALIISDLGLPGTDGFELMRRIRAIEKQRALTAVPSMAFTAFARECDRTASIEAGYDRYSSKPAKVETLLLTARDLMESK